MILDIVDLLIGNIFAKSTFIFVENDCLILYLLPIYLTQSPYIILDSVR